jgi:hypothetical protein
MHFSPRRVDGIIDPATSVSIGVFYYEINELQFVNIKVLQNMQLWRFGSIGQGV